MVELSGVVSAERIRWNIGIIMPQVGDKPNKSLIFRDVENNLVRIQLLLSIETVM